MTRSSLRPALTCLASAAALAALCAGAAHPAAASTIRVDPIKVEISSDRKIASIRLKNEESGPVAIRAYALAWSQKDGEDRNEETDAIIVSPPVATIAAGATQLVRVGVRPGASSRGAYRLIIEEIPQAEKGGGVRVALRLSLPLYVNLASGQAQQLGWKLFQRADGAWVAEATNATDRYIRAEVADVAAATGISPSAVPGFGVVLPNSRRRWLVGPKPAIADRARYEAAVRGTNSGASPPR
jgi:fimbrial chaperone protein